MKASVLHVIRPAEGGMKGHLLAIAGGLRENGYSVEVACPGDTAMAGEVTRMGFPVHPVNLVGPLNPVKDITCINELRRIMRRGKYDLVHFHGAKAGLVGRLAAVTAGYTNTVLTVHNFIIYDEVPAAKKVLFRYGEKLLSRVTARTITVSKALKEDLVDNYNLPPERIIPIYNGINLSRYLNLPDRESARKKLGIKPGPAVVGTVARMAPQKGLKYLVEAVEIIKKANRDLAVQGKALDTVFVIAGDGPLRPELEQLAEQKGVWDKILFPGCVQDMAGTLACFDIFVAPSIAEGLSITTIEAMAAGLPVVASRVGGLPELVREGVTGLLVEPRNPRSLAEGIIRLLADEEARQQFGQNGRNFAAGEFSTEKMVSETCRVYEEILKE